MGNGGINNRKSPCPLRAIKLQAIFFRRSYIYPSRFFRTSSPRAAGLRQPRRGAFTLFSTLLPLVVTTYLPTLPPLLSSLLHLRPLLFVSGIYLFASVSALLHTCHSPPPLPLLPVHPRVPRLPLSFFSSPSSCSSLSTRGPYPPFAFTASRTFLS